MNVSDYIKAIHEAENKVSPYDTPAEVVRIDDDGTAWVHIPGGEEETPVTLTINAKEGDTVQVRVAGGTAFLVGNESAPPTDDAKAIEAQEVAEVASAEAKQAAEIATGAAKIAGDTNQYFWHTEEGTDTGAHITEVPQDDFIADPSNGGANLLARSNGIAVRNGLAELATFSSNKIELGKNSYNSSIEMCGGTAVIELASSSGSMPELGIYARNVTSGIPTILTLRPISGDGNDDSFLAMMGATEVSNHDSSIDLQFDYILLNAVEEIQCNADFTVLQGCGITLGGSKITAFSDLPTLLNLVPQTSTSWIEPTITSQSCTIVNGGYYVEGKRVYIQMRLTLASNLNADSGRNIMSDFPVPLDVNAVPLAVLANNRGGAGARITNGGVLQVIADIDHGITAGQNIDISGVYTIS